MTNLKLFVVLLGGKDKEDKIEAHNLFIGVGNTIDSLLPKIKKDWPSASHVDAYMILNHVDGHRISIEEVDGLKMRIGTPPIPTAELNIKSEFPKLVMANIGYYKKGEFAEFHKLLPIVLQEGDKITEKVKSDPDFLKGQDLGEKARSHVDDKHYITDFDVDDVIDVQSNVAGYSVFLTPEKEQAENVLCIGYLFSELKTMQV